MDASWDLLNLLGRRDWFDGKIDTAENTRYPMQWNKSLWNHNFLNLYKTIIQIKKDNKALWQGSYNFMYADHDTVVLLRAFKSNLVLAIIYKGEAKKRISLDFSLYINSEVEFNEAFTSEVFCTKGKKLSLNLINKTSLLLIV